MFKSKLFLLIVFALLCSSLSGCNVVNSMRMMQINSNVQPQFSGQSRVALEALYAGEKPYVYATVNGERLLFLLDTGARFLILMDTPKVQRLDLPRGFDLALSGWGQDGKSQAYQTEIQRIDLGGVAFDGMKAAMIPVSQTNYYLREDEAIYDGVIGHDMMRHFAWEFDANANTIYLSADAYQPEENAQMLEMSSFMSKVSVTGTLAFNDDVTVTESFIIDTGSRHYVKLSTAYPEANDIAITGTRVRAADFGLSGKVEHDRVSLPQLTLGDIAIEHVKVNLIPSDDEDDWWILGNALMNQFKTVVDYTNDAFYLVPQEPYVTDYNLLGLELRKIRSGEFVVRYVFPNLPSSHFDIQVGDIVTQIDGKPAALITLSEYNDIASIAGQHKLCISRDGLCFNVITEEIAGYSLKSK
ncbi:aspartyl protease family protein [Alteromonas sp. ASW11-36]|uniref:Aspartyl protease family protein n=1 Tax=Alteromonas arenosi TaxID=3055817 RepID=A0ABT7SW44_9ALTE|nr:aspartyl protease family protein [Alteromonas sp. ASW11-36]MDM7860412.1 aspartyl protease family protein [Alteromonas sp. ASW11-36]